MRGFSGRVLAADPGAPVIFAMSAQEPHAGSAQEPRAPDARPPGDPICLQRNRNSLPASRSYAGNMAERANVYPLRREPKPELRPQQSPPPEPLWREALGRRIHALRSDRQETLSE